MMKIDGVAAILAAMLVVLTECRDPKLEASEREGREFILKIDRDNGLRQHKAVMAEWMYSTNMTKENMEKKVQIQSQLSIGDEEAFKELNMYDWKNFQDYSLRRMFEMYNKSATTAPDEVSELLIKAISDMSATYSTATVCEYRNSTKCDLGINTEIPQIFSKSHDPEELKYYWVEWHKEGGTNNKDKFIQAVKLSNEFAKSSGVKSMAEMWQQDFEVSDFEEQLAKIWEDVKPLYYQLHAYVRRHLRYKYGEELVSAKGPIPAHLLGNMWAQTWADIESFTRPYPEKNDVDITQAMVNQNYTALKMFQMSDEFYQSLNLTAMPDTFWNYSIFTKPSDREITCHASAWDFYDGEDFRIRMCTTIDAQHFKTVHHEMGHVQYYMQYRNLPVIFRDGANPGFHEAIGDTIALSVSSPKHLHRVGLLKEYNDDEQTEINQLYNKALDKIAFLPYGYLLDLFRYGVFRGTTQPEDYNCHYWRLREEYQGVEPPVTRTEEDFDAGAKYHMVSFAGFIRYYVAYIIQFQFHRSLCDLAEEYVPGDFTKKLGNCDIYQSAAAGNALAKMLQMGASRRWPDAMEALTGQREIKADGILEFFKPLHEWLIQENNRTGEYIGWEPSKTQYCTPEQLAALSSKETTPAEAEQSTLDPELLN